MQGAEPCGARMSYTFPGKGPVQYAHLDIAYYHILQMLAYDLRIDQSRTFLAYVEVFFHYVEDINRRAR